MKEIIFLTLLIRFKTYFIDLYTVLAKLMAMD